MGSYSNLGDAILLDTCKYLVETYIHKNSLENICIDTVDLMINSKELEKQKKLSKIGRLASAGLTVFAEKMRNSKDCSHALYSIKNKIKYSKYFASKIKDADAIIFVGGAYLKYKGEEFQYSITHLIRKADKVDVPVMLNATGIEGYDEKDIRCQSIKKSINLPCVKTITTRDDVEYLKQHYITRSDLCVDEVGDTALWVPECYGIKKSPQYDVGINVANPQLFKNNKVASSKTIMEILKEVIVQLQERNLSVALYCNGKVEDHEGGKQLKNNQECASVVLCDRPTEAKAYIDMVKNFRCIVPIRLHAIIVGYTLGIPSAGLLWNEKERVFLERSQMIGNFQEINEFSADKLAERIQEIVLQQEETTNILAEMKQKTYLYIEQFLRSVL